MKEISAKKWGKYAIVFLVVLLFGSALLTYIVDPYFHFHKPIEGMTYRLYEQRYINNGISRNFDYDAVITGNSLSENTKTSEFDKLFGTKSIKLPYSGAGFKELWGSLERTLSYNSEIRKVLVLVDPDDIARDKDYARYDDYPEYLYDDDVWNDSSYLWNKEVFYRGTFFNLLMPVLGIESTTFDEYSSWERGTGPEIVIPMIGDIAEPGTVSEMEYSDEKKEMAESNIRQNVLSVIEQYPNVEFDLIYCPPSIAQWCQYYNRGEVEYRINSIETMTELLVEKENVKLFSMLTDFDTICDLYNYSDTIHYTPAINSYMLETISRGERQLTLENYTDHINQMRSFYNNYDYPSLADGEKIVEEIN